MGVVVPKVDGENLKLSTEDRGLGLIGGSPLISMRKRTLTHF